MKSRTTIGVLFLAMLPTSIFAQFSFSVGGGSGLTSLPDRSGNYYLMAAPSLVVSENMEIGLSFAYQRFRFSMYGTNPNYKTISIPITIESRIFFSRHGVRPYMQAELGAAQTESNYAEYPLFPTNTGEYAPLPILTRRDTEWNPLMAIGFGALIPANETISLDLGLRMGMVFGESTSQTVSLSGRPPDGFPVWFSNNNNAWGYLRFLAAIRFRI